MLGSVLGYLYHLAMGRMMRPEDYAVIATLLSVFLLVSVVTNSILTVVMRYTAKYQAEGNTGAIATLQHTIGRKMFWAGLCVSIVFALLSPLLKDFWHIDSLGPIITMSLVFLFVFPAFVYRGILQGAQQFKSLVVSNVAEATGKLAFGLILVFAGWYVFGAVAAIVISTFIGLVTAWWFLRKSTKKDVAEIDTKGMFKYAIPVISMLFFTTLLYNIDLILVKHYFVGNDAGYYAALSQLGKIIVFATISIPGVMFPMIATKFEKKENTNKIFWEAFGIIAAICLLATAIYFVAPDFVIGLLYGSEYLTAAPLLGFVAIFMSLYSISYLVVQFFLSVKDYSVLSPLIIGSVLQIVLIIFFHDSLKQVIYIMDISMAIIAVTLLIYYVFKNRQLKKTFSADTSVQRIN